MDNFLWSDMNESNPRHSIRRASEPDADLSLVSNTKRRAESSALYTRVPLPLPYSPSDYLPSPTSPKHWAYVQPSVIPNSFPAGTPRVRSRSIGPSSSSPVSDTQPPQRPLLAIENGEREHFELVPYREWTVISCNDQRGQMVLYNPENQMVTVQRYIPDNIDSSLPNVGSSPHPMPTTTSECPFCHRPFDDTPDHHDEPTFMDRNYFRLLASATAPLQKPAYQEPQTSASASVRLNVNAFNQGYYAKFFVEKRKLGRGFRGSVYLCEHELDGVKLGKYAIKKVAIGNNHPWLVKMLREVHLLERLRHPNIVSYKHSWLESSRLTKYVLLQECANGGNLEEYLEPEEAPPSPSRADENPKSSQELKRERIRKFWQQQNESTSESPVQRPETQKRLLSMPEIFSLFLDIVQGLAHLHRQSIVHRDLKPNNLLLKWDDPNTQDQVLNDWASKFDRQGIPRVLISDFGECEDLQDAPDKDRTGATGTLEFMAPEHVSLDEHGRNTVEYTFKADMWSLGMVLYYLCYSTLPYGNVDDVDVLREEILAFKEVRFPKSRFDIYKHKGHDFFAMMHKKSIHADIPQTIKILIRALLSIDPSKRPSCQEILSKLNHMEPSTDHTENTEGLRRIPSMQENTNGPPYMVYEHHDRSWQPNETSNSVVQPDAMLEDATDKIQPLLSDDAIKHSATNAETDEDSVMEDSSTYSKKRGGVSVERSERHENDEGRKRQKHSAVHDGYGNATSSTNTGTDSDIDINDINSSSEMESRCLAPPPELIQSVPSPVNSWSLVNDPQTTKVVKIVTAILKVWMDRHIDVWLI
ncbi:putative serine/threonine-protein kinase iks1 [Apophysomyces sp. BC1015]|nr:putative serine/threonine-protein kinase iks1 [Apophysomyces sp. BC1015]